MESHIKGVLDAFASHLRLDRERFALTDVARKYLALGTNVVPTQWVYDAISSDYALLALKTHNPPLGEYADPRAAPVDVVTFAEIVKHGFDAKKNAKLIESAAEFARFKDSALAPAKPGQEQERWVEAARTDKWKDVALYLGLNYKEHTQFDALLKQITGQQDVSDLRKRMRAYKPDDKRALAAEMGQFIAAVELADSFVESVESATAPAGPVADSKQSLSIPPALRAGGMETTPSKNIAFTAATPSDETKSVASLKSAMEAYRKRAGLGVIVDTKRVAHQMVCSALNQEHDALLTRSQQRLEPLKGDEEHALVLDIVQSDALDDTRLRKALPLSQRAQCVALACNKWTWEPRTLLAYMVDPKENMDTRSYARFEKLLANNTNPETPFLQALFE